VIVLLLAAAAGAASSADDWQIDALAVHISRHPAAEAGDCYKFLHQAVFGPGHMISDRAAAASYLSKEIETLGTAKHAEHLCEALGGDPAMVRIHLRPFLAAGHDETILLDLFVDSANRVSGDPEVMEKTLRAAVLWLESSGNIELSAGLEALRIEQRQRGFPALHHSDAFRAAYHPAYRIILADRAHDHGWCP
jgi:hypothetical protein